MNATTTNPLTDALDAAGWDPKTGHLPVHPCTNCGNPLDDGSGGRPAETYAGTYTGLCYPCTSLSEFKVSDNEDGSTTWSYPPSCPSWRRDRETYTGFADCEKCHGKGVEGNDYANGSSHRRFCRDCSTRARELHEAKVAREVDALLADALDVPRPPVPGDRKITVAIVLQRGSDTHEVEALLSDTPGLVVHKIVRQTPDGPVTRNGEWSVTHQPSGLRVAQTTSRKAALSLAAALHGLVDFTLDQSELAADPRLRLVERAVKRLLTA